MSEKRKAERNQRQEAFSLQRKAIFERYRSGKIKSAEAIKQLRELSEYYTGKRKKIENFALDFKGEE